MTEKFLKSVSVRFLLMTLSIASPSAALAAPVAPHGGSAAPNAEPDSLVTDLPEVDVVAFHVSDIIRPERLEGKTLERLNAHSVADAVRYFSGVQLKDYGGVGGVKTLDIRSLGSSHLGVFYDGIQLGNAQNGQIDLGKFSLDNIEEIALYNGEKSTLLQPARDFASAGTIYIKSRTPRFHDGRDYNLDATFRTGSFGLVNPSLRGDWKISPTVALSASAEFTHATGRYKFRYRKRLPDGALAWDTVATRRNGALRSWRAEAGLYGSPAIGPWHAKVYFYDSSRGIPGAIVNNVWKNSQKQWDTNIFVQGSWKLGFTPRLTLLLNGKYANDRMRYLNPDTTLMHIDNTFRQQEVYLSACLRYSILRNWSVAAAADWQHNTLKANITDFRNPRRNTLLASVATSAAIGSFHFQASLLLNSIHDRTRLDSRGIRMRSSRTVLSPAIFLNWKLPFYRAFALKAFAKKSFRMPTFNDLYYTDMGSADLKPETAWQFDAGLVWTPTLRSPLLNFLELSADVYHNRVDDKIIAVPKGNGQYRWMMMNIGKVRILGVDVNASAEMTLPGSVVLGGRLTYTYQSARDFSDPSDCLDAAGTYKSQIAYIPLHSGSVAAHAGWKGLELNYSWIYTGKRWQNSSNIPVNLVQPWYTHDITIGYTLSLPGKSKAIASSQPGKGASLASSLRIAFEVNNLFDQQYEVIANYPMPGRNYKLILQWHL